MATYSDVVVSTSSGNGTASGGSTTLYTCPAGKRAEGVIVWDSGVATTGARWGFNGTVAIAAPGSYPFELDSGQTLTIESSSGTVEGSFTAREYPNP